MSTMNAADHHDDTTETQTKSSRTKPSDTLRRSQACLARRKRKLRCDARKPSCTRSEKAWLAYNPGDDGTGSSTPPCEYDTSLLARIFKRSNSDDELTSSSSMSRQRDTAQEEQNEQLWEENEQLRAHIWYLPRQLQQNEDI
ncbi:uncharacterized protein UHOD_11745 [Ustilago sp. UG-2017b]|nr:uncharacterized protein UHOD_11745 [Ustilago sp. UG-2017b]